MPGDDDDNDGVRYSVRAKGPDKEEMVAEYLPERDDWAAKTILDLNDPGRVAILGNMDQLFPEIEHLQPVLDDFLENFLKSRTSVGGQSRDEYQRIFESMFGGASEDKTGSKLMEALNSSFDDD